MELPNPNQVTFGDDAEQRRLKDLGDVEQQLDEIGALFKQFEGQRLTGGPAGKAVHEDHTLGDVEFRGEWFTVDKLVERKKQLLDRREALKRSI